MSKSDKNKKPRPEPASAIRDFSAGWIFWLLSFAVLFGPAWFWASRNAFTDQQSGVFPWFAAFTLATIGAGVVTWATNSGLQWWSRRANRLARKKR